MCAKTLSITPEFYSVLLFCILCPSGHLFRSQSGSMTSNTKAPDLSKELKWLDTYTQEDCQACCKDLSGVCHQLAQEPGMALFRVCEHIIKSAPLILQRRDALREMSTEVSASSDALLSLALWLLYSAVKSILCNRPLFLQTTPCLSPTSSRPISIGSLALDKWTSTPAPPPPCISYALVQATVRVGAVMILYVI